MAAKKELTVEDKLRALYDLQLIDSRIDKIRSLRGELPMEVEDLEDEVAGLKTRVDKLKSEIETLNFEIGAKKNLIEEKCRVLSLFNGLSTLLLPHRKRYTKCASFIFFALNGQPTAVATHNVFDDRQSKPRSAKRP